MISPTVTAPADLLAAALHAKRLELACLNLSEQDKKFLAACGIAVQEAAHE